MQPDGKGKVPSDGNGKQAARVELRRAIKSALAHGLGWQEIIRTLAEHGPAELPELPEVPVKGADGHGRP
jgi:hypothetical protein